MLTEHEVLTLAQQRHPQANALAVMQLDPENWPAIYEFLGCHWPVYERPLENCPQYMRGRNVLVGWGDWFITAQGKKSRRLIGMVEDNLAPLVEELKSDFQVV